MVHKVMNTEFDHKFMNMAIEEALAGKKEGQKPFGCIVVSKDGEVLSRAHDTVLQDSDITSHSEVTAIRLACQKHGLDLSDCIVYTTCEPCPMCFGAMWLANVEAIVSGCTMTDVVSNSSIRQFNISPDELNVAGGSRIRLVKDIMRDECIRLFK